MDNRGHHYELARSITRGASAQNIPSVWLSNRRVRFSPKPQNVAVIPSFATSMYDGFKQGKTSFGLAQSTKFLVSRLPNRIRNRLVSIRDLAARRKWYPAWPRSTSGPETDTQAEPTMADEFLEALATAGLGSTDHVLAHTADGDIFRSILELALTRPDFEQIPYIHLCTPYELSIMPHADKGLSVTRVIRYLELLGLLNQRVFLYAENKLLGTQLSKDWSTEVRPLELPPPGMPLRESSSCAAKLRIAYVGAAREEKGFFLLPEVLEKIWDQPELRSRIQFVIQCSPQILGYAPGIENAIKRISRYPKGFVKLVHKEQSQRKYQRHLEESDVVWLCYERSRYRVRGSGIAVEAMSLGKLLLTTPDTFLSAIAQESGVSVESVDEIVRAIQEILKNKPERMERARKRAQRYREENSAENYVRSLIRRAESAEQVKADRRRVNAEISEEHATTEVLGSDVGSLFEDKMPRAMHLLVNRELDLKIFNDDGR